MGTREKEEAVSGAIVRTPTGVVTSTKVAWRTSEGRDAWTWRVDANQPPKVWASVAEAQAWVDYVWLIDPKEKERSGWVVVAV